MAKGKEEYCKEDFDLNISYSDWLTRISSSKRLKMSENDDDLCGDEPEDADYSGISSLSYELESLIFAKFPRSEYWKLCFVNKRCLSLVKSGELYKIRNMKGFKEPSVFMSASGQQNSWWAFDREFKSSRKLPVIPSDPCFVCADKESICVGTHLLVLGKEIEGLVIWRYELANNQWLKGQSMNNPRCLFASATCGNFAYVARGTGAKGEIYNIVEKYDSDSGTWDSLPRMKKRRRLCAGCYMDNKFYVIGGRNEGGELTCGEFFDESSNRWELIPDMLKDYPVQSSETDSPPLLAVVNNELYLLESSSNLLKVYLKKTNSWKELGPVPVRADYHKGWGVAFKSLGNELLVIGASADYCAFGESMAIFVCCPGSDSSELQWRRLESRRNRLSHFILNCSVMVA